MLGRSEFKSSRALDFKVANAGELQRAFNCDRTQFLIWNPGGLGEDLFVMMRPGLFSSVFYTKKSADVKASQLKPGLG